MKPFLRCALTAVALSLGFASVARCDEVRMQGGGSTFINPIMQTWVAEYQKAHPDVKIDYQSIGSGGGIKGIMDHTFEFGASDAPLSKKDLAAMPAPVIQFPLVAGAVVPAYNIPDLKGDLKLDGPTLVDIYMNKITKWNDPKIVALNPGMDLPDLQITPAHRSDGSGTSYIFSNFLASQSDEFAEKVGAGKQPKWDGGQAGKGNDGVSQIVESTKGAIGYIELAYAVSNKIPFAQMKNKDGKIVTATPDSAAAAGEDAAKDMKENLVAPLWNRAGENVWPITGFTYAIIYKDLSYLKDAGKAKALTDFLTWAAQDGQKMATGLQYAPLTGSVQTKVAAAISGAK